MDMLLILFFFLLLHKVSAQNCNYYQDLFVGIDYQIYSPGYDNTFPSGTKCRWAAEAPPGYKIQLNCDDIVLLWTPRCKDNLKISRSGRVDMGDAITVCGMGIYTVESTSTKMIVTLESKTPFVGLFRCMMRAVENTCKCGHKNPGRIVGGVPTLPNEYPMMAGLTDIITGKIFCGATIISQKYLLSAAHCFTNRTLNSFVVVVGEQDVTTGQDTNATALYRVRELKVHPNYNSTTYVNDVALIVTTTPITFSYRVGPSCLPFRYRGENLLGKTVTATGWGSTEFGGAFSDELLKVDLNIINSTYCNAQQICAFAENKDTCQGDSGGPLFLSDDNLIFNVGIVSYGIECARPEYPGVYARVSEYLNFILQNSKTTVYCVM